MLGKITVNNRTEQVTTIDIEGIIGIPETWQFDDPGERVATYERFKNQIERIGVITTPEIVVNIRSTGGNVNDALLIFDRLREPGRTITTRCYGYVASAATIIAQAASTGRREISENTLYLIHKSVTATEGNSNGMMHTLELLDKTDRRIAEIYAAASGKSAEGFAALMGCNNGNGRWLDAEEAVSAFLADRIIGATPVTNDAAEQLRLLNLPEVPETKTTNPKSMKIKQQWSALLELLGLVPGKDNALTELQLEKINEKLTAKALQAEMLQNRIGDLETENARLQAKATQTMPKEDPAFGESKLSENARAYDEDARNFR